MIDHYLKLEKLNLNYQTRLVQTCLVSIFITIIFYNQDYHCVLHQVLPIFLHQEERTYFDQDSKPGRAANYGKSILSLLQGKVDLLIQ